MDSFPSVKDIFNASVSDAANPEKLLQQPVQEYKQPFRFFDSSDYNTVKNI